MTQVRRSTTIRLTTINELERIMGYGEHRTVMRDTPSRDSLPLALPDPSRACPEFFSPTARQDISFFTFLVALIGDHTQNGGMLDPNHPLAELLRRDRRYHRDAYIFVFEALRYAQEHLDVGQPQPAMAGGAEEERHVTGQQL